MKNINQTVVFAIPWKRQGFEKKFVSFNDLDLKYKHIFENSKFLGTSGRNRLDMKDNIFFIFKYTI